MTILNMLNELKVRLLTKWVACSLIPDKTSVQYGIRFSYPIYILIVIVGIVLANPFILLAGAVIAFLAIKLPIHPFDYVYNYAANLFGAKKIPGRGSELQVNSFVALVFNLIVFILIILNISINFNALAIIYALSSVYFVGIFLFRK